MISAKIYTFLPNIYRCLIIIVLCAALHASAVAVEPLLQRKMPPTFTSLPLLIRTFTQKGTRSERALIVFENRSIVLMYYFQNEYVIREFRMESEIFDIIEAYADETNLESNYYLVSADRGISLFSLGSEPWSRIDFASGVHVRRFLALHDNNIVGYDRGHVSIISLSASEPGIERIDNLYHAPDNDIVTVAFIPPSDRFLVVRETVCVALRTDGCVEWTHELPEPMEKRSGFASTDRAPPIGEHGERIVHERLSAIEGRSSGAHDIWDSYKRPVRVTRNDTSDLLLYPSGDNVMFCQIESDSLVHRVSVPCGGRVLDICPTDSTVLVTGGGSTGSRYTGFLFEIAYDGSVLQRMPLSYPGVFIRRLSEGFALQGFRNHLLLLGEDLRILAVDHSPLYPTSLAVLELDGDASDDLLVGGLSAMVSIPDTLVNGTIEALGEQESFRFLSKRGDRYMGSQYRVDGYLVGIERQRRAATVALAGVRSIDPTKRNVNDMQRSVYATRELFYRIGDDDGVASCDAELKRIDQWKFDSAWFIPLVLLGCVIGGVTGVISRRKKLFLTGLSVFVCVAFVQWHLLSLEAAIRAVMIGAVALLAVSFLRNRFRRGAADMPLPGPSRDRYTGFLMALGAFDHSGRATQILESLHLLLLSFPDSPDEYPGYRDRLRRRCNAFLETVAPQIREIAEILRSILPRKAMSSELEVLLHDLESGLSAIVESSFPDTSSARLVSGTIDALEKYMKRLRHVVRDHPGAPIVETVEEIVESKRNEIVTLGAAVEIIERLRNTRIVAISRHELDAVCENLVSNSLKAIRESAEKKIMIELFEEGSFVILRHGDSGAGIDASKKRALFTPRRSIEKGGFGLPYTAFVVERAGGTIELGESILGGATFVVKLRPWHLVMRSFINRENGKNAAADGHGDH